MYIHRYVLLFWCTSMFKCFALYSLNQVIGDLPLSSRWFGEHLLGQGSLIPQGNGHLGPNIEPDECLTLLKGECGATMGPHP